MDFRLKFIFYYILKTGIAKSSALQRNRYPAFINVTKMEKIQNNPYIITFSIVLHSTVKPKHKNIKQVDQWKDFKFIVLSVLIWHITIKEGTFRLTFLMQDAMSRPIAIIILLEHNFHKLILITQFEFV